uniref:Uncharacterized protein n=1 Tax=Fagus sylvatica TaxID=28930 RepID=A0A2N9FE55_FAGSY
MWGFASSLGGLCLFEDNEFLMWLVSSLWQMVWRLHPARALPLERFRSESLMLFPPCLRLFHQFARLPFADPDYTGC